MPLIQVYIPLGAVSLISLLFVRIPFLSDLTEGPLGNFIVGLLDFLFVLLLIFTSLAGIIAITKIYNGGKAKVNEIFKQAVSKYIKYFLFMFVLGLIYTLGSIAFIFPLILFWTWFVFGKFIFVENKSGIKASLSESKKIVKGIFWKVFARILVFGIFSVCCNIALAFLPYGIGDIVFSLLGAFFLLPQFLLYKEITEKRTVSE